MFETAIGDFHFLRPFWLVGVVAAVLLAWRLTQTLAATSAWRRAIDPGLLAALIEPGTRGTGRAIATLAGIGVALACVALAGPTWKRLPQPVEQSNDALVVVLDLSLSMLAEDLSPSRSARAKHKVIDVLRNRQEGLTGLVVYAGDAHTVAPLTDDVHTIENLLDALAPEIMPVLGSNPGDAIQHAERLFANSGISQGRILLVTDGVDRIDEVSTFAKREFPISIIGIGTDAGGQIPLAFLDRPGQYLTDDSGRPIVARLDRDRLATLASACWGRYATLAVGDSDIDATLSTPLPGREETVAVDREFDTWADAGYWLAAALLPLALLGFRRGALLVVCLAAVPLHANVWDNLWKRPDQQAYEALRDGEPDRAATLFEDSRWRGVAHYRSGSYELAEQLFREDHGTDGAYNRGNALAHIGRYDEAIAAYDRALEFDPTNEDARTNKALVERLRDQQQQQASANDNQEAQRNSGENDAEQSRAGESSQQPEEQRQSGERPEESPNDSPESNTDSEQKQSEIAANDSEEEREEARDEEQDALEQWLRRVPDDPGGLLRRKFQYESNQRQRESGSDMRQRQQIW